MHNSFSTRPTWSEINLDNLTHNFKSVKSFVGKDTKYMAVIKADAYGHGAVKCAKRLEVNGIDWFGVALVEEAIELRKYSINKPILCLGGIWHGQEEMLIENNITPVIYQIDAAKYLNQSAKLKNTIVKVHLKVDTGMGRIGIRFDEFKYFAEKLKDFKNLDVEGIMSHFAAADNLSENDFTNLQISRFKTAVKTLREIGFNPIYEDMANSPGAIAHENARKNMVRLGGVLYGLGGDILPKEIVKPVLKPMMSLHSKIAYIKRVPKGESIGYGRTFTTEKDSLIASIPIGYHDGYCRSLSNHSRVIINDKYCPVVGRISMDWTLVDVTNVPNVKVNDEVILIGKKNGLSVLAEELAEKLNTISYEITCGINPRVTRKYVGSEEK